MTKPLFDVFREAMLNNPDGSRKEAIDYFIEQMRADPAEYLGLLAQDYFERYAAHYTVRELSPHSVSVARTDASAGKGERISAALVGRAKAPPRPAVIIAPETMKEARQKREEAKQRTAKAFDELKERIPTIKLLDLPMPNGKLLRDSTGAECIKAGGFYTAIGEAIKPTQVVDKHLAEADLQNIRARFYQVNRETAA